MEWQPIETAPKDDACFLVNCPYVDGSGSIMFVVRSDMFSVFSNYGEWLPRLQRPTHWMPLPPAPQ